MEAIIFLLPLIIIILFFIMQIFVIVKRIFISVLENADKFEQTGGLRTFSGKKNIDLDYISTGDYDQEKVKEEIEAAEAESFQQSKKRILKEHEKKEKSRSFSEKRNKINQNKVNSEKDKGSLAEIFANYNEVEKAVIYNELLSKPKALRKK